MLPILAAALVSVAYSFPLGKTVCYDVEVAFDGFIPLFGGQNAKVEVKMEVEATGTGPDEKGNPQVFSELKTLDLLLNGAKFPLGAENAKGFFPKTTISMSPSGQVLETDAPDVQMPFRLPGLDAKRFPDITYLPLEFPKEGVEAGRPFTFKKSFGGSDVTYTVTPTKIEEASIGFKIRVQQSYVTFEDIRLQVVSDEKEAVNKVETTLTGEGTATFDRMRGLVSELDLSADAISKAVDLKSKVESERKLKTRLIVRARDAG